MGAGKTMAAITMMNEEKGTKFLFVTKFLSEVERIKEACRERDFVEPQHYKDGKLSNLNSLLAEKRNVASTHALFYKYSEETLDAVKKGEYTLILDEVVDVLTFASLAEYDVKSLFDFGYAETEDGRVVWLNDDYPPSGVFGKIKESIETCFVTRENNQLLVWTLPLELFTAFKEVIVLSYMFDAQLQYYYYKLSGVEIEYLGVERRNGIYRFTNARNSNRVLLPKINILEDDRVNLIGDDRFALSSSWYKRAASGQAPYSLLDVKNNIYNVFNNKFKSKSSKNLWTTYKDYQPLLAGSGYKKGFLECSARATNDWADRNHLAYCVNVFMNPNIKHYFYTRGCAVDEESWSLSEMVQWIWRSSVRKGEEIWVYIPSSRMRWLFSDWVKKVSS